ncbi:hypothetical protein ABK040_016536 [Willaertia magna]
MSSASEIIIDATAIEKLIEEGNAAFKTKNYQEAEQKYSEAYQSLTNNNNNNQTITTDFIIKQKIRICNNRSQTYLLLKQYEQALNDCNLVLKADEFNEKGYIRKIQALKGLNQPEQAFETLLSALRLLSSSSEQNNLQNEQQNKEAIEKITALKSLFPNMLDLFELIKIGTEQTNKYIFSTHQLKDIEHKKYHDTWKLEEYFDPMSENKKFDVPCPPDQFMVNENLINNELEVIKNLALTNKGTPTNNLRDYGDAYCVNPTYGNDTNFPLSLQYYYKFAYGEKKPFGFANVAWIRSLFKLKAQKKDFYILLPDYKNTTNNNQKWSLKKVKDFGLQVGNVRCKSINCYFLHRGDVVVRDYDTHIWSRIILQDINNGSSEEKEEEIFIDFFGPIYNHFNYLKINKLPCRIFNRETLTQDEQIYNEDYKGIYRCKQRDLMGKDANNYIIKDYNIEFKLNPYPQKLYAKLDLAFEYEYRTRNYLPKPSNFI